jgi:hypothetical protein
MTTPTRVPLHEHPNYPRRACLDVNPNLFHQADGERWEKARHRLEYAARMLCRRCPVLQACRAQGDGAEWGLWGGVFHRRDHGEKKSIDLLQGVA